jgi:plastocyanin
LRKSIAMVLAAVLAASLVVAASLAMAATKTVRVKQPNRWASSSVSIKRGDTVRWTWSGGPPHNVQGPGFKSRTASRLTYRRRFSRRGSYRIVCTVHRSTMRMTVRVR